MKKRLTQSEEFEIMKLVLDKFLWVGIAVVGFGLWKVFTEGFAIGFTWMFVGVIILILFMVLIVREYEIIE